MYYIIKTGSTGNSIIYFGNVMVDCGLPFFLIKPFLNDIQIVLLSHQHSDHINISTLKKMAFERPTLRIGCGEWMLPYLEGFKNIDVYKAGKIYDYGSLKVSPVILYHDVPNFGYRIFKEGKRILHVTDTNHLQGISAKGYDLYALEANYNSETVFQLIQERESRGEYAHQRGAINSHLSEQQANDFFFKNKDEHSKLIRLHQSTTSL